MKSRAPLWIALGIVGAVVVGGAGWYLIGGRGGNVAVTVTTNPNGADVYLGEQLVGPSPVVVKLPRDGEPHTIAVKKDGYLTAQRVVSGKESSTLNLKLTPIPVEDKEEAPPPPAPAPKAETPPLAKASKRVEVVADPPKAEPAKAEPKATAAPKKHHTKPKSEDTLILTPSF
jgi:hypothetical protein